MEEKQEKKGNLKALSTPGPRNSLETHPDNDSWEGLRDQATMVWQRFWDGSIGPKEVNAALGIIKLQSENLEKRQLDALAARVQRMERGVG